MSDITAYQEYVEKLNNMVKNAPRGLRVWFMLDYPTGDYSLKGHRTNHGYDAFQLLGNIECAKQSIVSQIKGTDAPEVVTKTFIEDEQRDGD